MNQENQIQTAKILTSGKLPDRFLETKIYEPTNPLERKFGSTYILTEITTPWFPTARITKLISEAFLNEYYQNSNASKDSKRFEDGLRAVNKKLSELAGSGQTEWIGNLNAFIASIVNNKLYISHTGSAEAYLFRQNRISHITEGVDTPKSPLPIQTFSALISGDLEKGDRIVLSNSEMFNFVSIDTLRNAVKQLSPNNAVDEVADVLFREKAKKINAIFIYIKNKDLIESTSGPALPDTIFLDSEDEKMIVTPFKGRFRKVGKELKRGITKIGFGVLALYDRIQNLIIRKKETSKKEEKNILPQEEKNTPSSQNLPYTTSSIDLNTGYQSKSKKGKGFLEPVTSFFRKIWQFILGINRRYLFGGLAFLIIAIIIMGIFIRGRSSSQTSQDLTAVVTEAQEKINSAETQIALNNDGEARILLTEAKNLLLEIKDKPKSPVEVLILLERIDKNFNVINKVTKITSPKELANLSSLSGNIETKEIVYLNGVIYSINQKGREIFAVIAERGDKEVIAQLPENSGNANKLTYLEDDRVLVIESDNQFLFEFDIRKNKIEKKEGAKSDTFPFADSLRSYLNIIYILNKSENELYKYPRITSGYDKVRSSYKEGVVDLSNVVSIGIDGNIFLLHENGGIEKTLRGKIEGDFVVAGIPEPENQITSPLQLFTTVDSSSLYVLDKDGKRIVELNKSGQYLRQFEFVEGIRKINNIFVNEKAKKIYLLSDNKIFEIDI